MVLTFLMHILHFSIRLLQLYQQDEKRFKEEYAALADTTEKRQERLIQVRIIIKYSN